MSRTGIVVNGNTLYPSGVTWGLQDVSAPDAGRTLDAVMHKQMIAQKVKLSLSWQNVTGDVAAQVLNCFQPEYFNVTYLDPLTNGMVTKNFYAGDRSAVVYTWADGFGNIYSNISFDIIEV